MCSLSLEGLGFYVRGLGMGRRGLPGTACSKLHSNWIPRHYCSVPQLRSKASSEKKCVPNLRSKKAFRGRFLQKDGASQNCVPKQVFHQKCVPTAFQDNFPPKSAFQDKFPRKVPGQLYPQNCFPGQLSPKKCVPSYFPPRSKIAFHGNIAPQKCIPTAFQNCNPKLCSGGIFRKRIPTAFQNYPSTASFPQKRVPGVSQNWTLLAFRKWLGMYLCECILVYPICHWWCFCWGQEVTHSRSSRGVYIVFSCLEAMTEKLPSLKLA